MALFKILNNFTSGNNITSLTNHVQGYCYFDKNTGRFWIDTTNAASGMKQINGTFYGTTNSAANVAYKVVTCPGFSLSEGAVIFVRFMQNNTAGSATIGLNVNDTGAKLIRYRNEQLADTTILKAGRTYAFVYDGTYYQLIGDLDIAYDGMSSADAIAGTDTDPKLISASVLHSAIENYGFSTTTGTVTSISTGVGLLPSTAITTTGTIKLKLLSETALSNQAKAGSDGNTYRIYPLAIDSLGNLAVNVPWTNTTYSNATTSVSGLMSAADKQKLDNIAAGAGIYSNGAGLNLNNNVFSIKTGGVTNSMLEHSSIDIAGNTVALGGEITTATLKTALGVTTYSNATTSTAGLMSAADKAKLDGIAAGAKTGTVTKVQTGIGLTGGDITTTGTVKAKLKSETAHTASSATPTNTASRQYAVGVDADGYLSVNVPWTDNNTTYGELTTALIDTGTDTAKRVVSAKTFKDALNAYIAAIDAMVFKGVIGGNIDLPDTHQAGWTYRVGTAGQYAGQQCEVGDMVICIADGNTALNGDWAVIQNNLDGAVIGPASATDGKVAIFSGTSGKLIKQGTVSTATVIKTATLSGGAAPTMGTAFSVPNVTENTDVTASKVTKSDNTVVKTISQAASTSSVIGTVSDGVLTFTQAITAVGAVTAGSTATASAVTITDVTASKVTLGTAFSIPNVTSAGSSATLNTTTQTVVTGIS